MCKYNTITKRFKVTPSTSFWGGRKWTVEPGGWAVGVFTLEILYVEHKMFRNHWSDSNTGLDLARYRGTKLKLLAHPEYSYVFYWDTDYLDPQRLVQYAHPAIMINRSHHRVVIASRITGKCSQTVWIKAPAVMETDWRFSKDLADTGLFAFAVAFIDIENPWMYPGAPWSDEQQKKYWWYQTEGDDLPDWITKWTDVSAETADQAVLWGPFVLKHLMQGDFLQIGCTYKSYFQFAGEMLEREEVTDPKHPQAFGGRARIGPIWDTATPADPRHPLKQRIQPTDLTADGELSAKALKRICTTTDSDFTTISESDGSDANCLSPSRTRSTSRSAKKAKTKTKESSKTMQDSRHRVHGLSFDLFLGHIERELGRPLSWEEKLRATESFRKQKKTRRPRRERETGAASQTSPASSTWSCCG